jgi:hypothetical protein
MGRKSTPNYILITASKTSVLIIKYGIKAYQGAALKYHTGRRERIYYLNPLIM